MAHYVTHFGTIQIVDVSDWLVGHFGAIGQGSLEAEPITGPPVGSLSLMGLGI